MSSAAQLCICTYQSMSQTEDPVALWHSGVVPFLLCDSCCIRTCLYIQESHRWGRKCHEVMTPPISWGLSFHHHRTAVSCASMQGYPCGLSDACFRPPLRDGDWVSWATQKSDGLFPSGRYLLSLAACPFTISGGERSSDSGTRSLPGLRGTCGVMCSARTLQAQLGRASLSVGGRGRYMLFCLISSTPLAR